MRSSAARPLREAELSHQQRQTTPERAAVLDAYGDVPTWIAPTLGRIAGISIRVHLPLLVFVLALTVGMVWRGGWEEALLYPALLLTIAAHEMGHALTAKRRGYRIRKVLLHPLRSSLNLGRVRNASDEIAINLAGPAANLGLALLAWGGVAILGGVAALAPTVFHRSLLQEGGGIVTLAARLAIVNTLMAVVNLLPAFPFDGGRVLRANLSKCVNRTRATDLVSQVGRLLAIVLAVVGIAVGARYGWPCSLTALLILVGSVREMHFTSLSEVLVGVTAGDAMEQGGVTLTPGDTLRTVATRPLPPTQPAFPVVLGDRPLGILHRSIWERRMLTGGGDDYVSEAMTREVPTAATDEALEAVLQRTRDGLRTPFLVLDADGQLVGMITLSGIRRYIAERTSGNLQR